MAMSKKFVNDPKDVVDEMIAGIIASTPSLRKLAGHNVLLRCDIEAIRTQQVTLISGGGSGHEPAHAGYVGDGMLSAAVLGGMFASPSVASILAAIRTCTTQGAPGCLLIVKNYTGDRLNFGLALEKARAEGLRVEMVVVADDCALPRDKGITGRRGVAGTVFVHKVAGAAAAAGYPLDVVLAESRSVSTSVGTLGVALTTCTLPGQPVSDRLVGKIEVGLGIHGEPGMRQIDGGANADVLVDEMVAAIADGDNPYLSITKGDQLCVLLNNLGGTPTLELYICARRAISVLEARGASVVRTFVGPFMTSLEMQGVSLSVLKVNPLMLARIDSTTAAPAWSSAGVIGSVPSLEIPVPGGDRPYSAVDVGKSQLVDSKLSDKILTAMTANLIDEEDNLTAYDRAAGDGDCGITMKRGADAIQAALRAGSLPLAEGPPLLCMLADLVSGSTGGTSGVLFEIALRSGASALSEGKTWIDAFEAGINAIQFYGGAEAGYRTMLDALLPAAIAARDSGWQAAAKAATAGAESTKTMEPKAGRSNYVPREQLQGVPDPGAVAVAILLTAAAACM